MFSNLSSSSISLATVTPSLVMRGAPNDLSSTTFRPFGPQGYAYRVGENFTSLAAMCLFLRLTCAAMLSAGRRPDRNVDIPKRVSRERICSFPSSKGIDGHQLGRRTKTGGPLFSCKSYFLVGRPRVADVPVVMDPLSI